MFPCEAQNLVTCSTEFLDFIETQQQNVILFSYGIQILSCDVNLFRVFFSKKLEVRAIFAFEKIFVKFEIVYVHTQVSKHLNFEDT